MAAGLLVVVVRVVVGLLLVEVGLLVLDGPLGVVWRVKVAVSGSWYVGGNLKADRVKYNYLVCNGYPLKQAKLKPVGSQSKV